MSGLTDSQRELIRSVEPPDYAEADFGKTNMLAAYKAGFYDARQDILAALASLDAIPAAPEQR